MNTEVEVIKEKEFNEYSNAPVIFRVEYDEVVGKNGDLKVVFIEVCNNRNNGKYFVRFTNGGELPEILTGEYTSAAVAIDCIKNHIVFKRAEAENKRSYHKSRIPKEEVKKTEGVTSSLKEKEDN